MAEVDEVRLTIPPRLAPWLRVHPLLQAASDVAADFTDSELRLSSGAGRSGLFRLASDLATAAPLRLQLRQGAPRTAIDIELQPHMTLDEAMRTVLRECRAHLLDNVAGAGAGDAEAVHQARVAIRRLRAALLMFRPRLDRAGAERLDRASAEPLDRRLRDLGHVLGAARDWDVFLHETFATLRTELAGEDAWLDRLRVAAGEARDAAQKQLATVLGAPDFTRLALELGRWAEDAGTHRHGPRHAPRHAPRLAPRHDRDGHQALAEAAAPLLDRLLARCIRRGRALAQASVTERHALRKSLKKLRYGLEFSGSLFPHKATRRYLHRLKELQTRLGTINDSHVTLALAGEVVSRGRLDPTPAFGRLVAWSHGIEAAAGEVEPLWTGLLATAVPWRS